MAWPVSRSSITKRTVDPRVRLRIWILPAKSSFDADAHQTWACLSGNRHFFVFAHSLPVWLSLPYMYLHIGSSERLVTTNLLHCSLFWPNVRWKRQSVIIAANLCTRFIFFFIQIRLGTMTNQLKSYWKNDQSHLLSFTCVRHFRLRFVTWPIAVLTYDVVMDEDIGLFLSHDFRI